MSQSLLAFAIAALMCTVTQAQVGQLPAPSKPLSELVKPNTKLPSLAPDFEVKINSVQFSCTTSDAIPFATFNVTIKNKGGPFDHSKSIAWRWGVDGVMRSMSSISPWTSDIDSPVGKTYNDLTIPLSWFENKGKKGWTKLAAPLSVRATFEFDTAAAVAESNESNNASHILVTVPAMLCPN